MNKQSIIPTLLALVSMAGQGQEIKRVTAMPEDFMEHMAMYGYEVFTYDISSLRDSASGFTIVIREYDHQGMIDGKELKRLFEMNKYLKEKTSEIYKHLFLQIYSQHLDSYRLTVKERYIQLLNRCPQIVQQINLKDIASFLKVTPTTISKIRKEITFSV